jgi:hypothetical protein
VQHADVHLLTTLGPNMKRLVLIVVAVVGLFGGVNERVWLGVRAMCPPRSVLIMSWMVAKVLGGMVFAFRWVNERIWLARRNPYATAGIRRSAGRFDGAKR